MGTVVPISDLRRSRLEREMTQALMEALRDNEEGAARIIQPHLRDVEGDHTPGFSTEEAHAAHCLDGIFAVYIAMRLMDDPDWTH